MTRRLKPQPNKQKFFGSFFQKRTFLLSKTVNSTPSRFRNLAL
jgi:hypothetical protein